MKGKTHAAVGVATYVAIAGFNPAGIAVTAAASTLPDIDLKLKLKRFHRGITHSLFALFVLGTLTGTFYPDILLPVIIGYGSHLVLDSLTPKGVPWFWPIKKRFKMPIIRTGSIGDRLIGQVATLILAILIIREVANLF